MRCAVQCPPACHFINHQDGVKRTKLLFPNERVKKKKRKKDKHTNQVTKNPNGQIFCCWFLLQSLSFQPFTSHWGPSCWCPSQKPATPPWAGRTVTTRSNRSDREYREARERRLHREHRGVPANLHDRLYRKLVDRGHLRESRIHQNTVAKTLTKRVSFCS